MPDITWIAAGPGQASEPANWSLGRAPQNGDRVIWDGTSDNNCDWNLDKLTVTAGGWVVTAGYDGTIAQNTVTVGIGPMGIEQSGGTITGRSITYFFEVTDGAVNHTGGVQTGTTMLYKFFGVCSLRTLNTCGALYVSAGATVDKNSSNVISSRIETEANGRLKLNSPCELRYYSASAFNNSGEIFGTSYLRFSIYDADKTLTVGNVSCEVRIISIGTATANRTVSLAANTVVGGPLAVSSEHATYTTTLSHGSNRTLDVTGAVTVGTRGAMAQGTGQWSFGSYTQNGVSSSFTQGGPVSVLGDTAISDGTLTGLATATWTQGGSLTHTAGALASARLNLIFTGVGGSLSVVPGADVLSLRASANVALASSLVIAGGGSLIVDASKSISIALNKILEFRDYVGGSFTNLGLISGPGTLDLLYYNANQVRNLGTISCAIRFIGSAAALNNRVVTLGSSALLGSVSVSSNHASYTMTLDTAGFALQHKGLTVGTRGAVLFRGSKVVNYGNTDTSAGSADFGTSQYIQAGAGTIKTAAGQKLKHLVTLPSASLKLLSALTVSGRLIKGADNIDLNGNALTHEQPEELYDRCRVVLDTELGGGPAPYGPEMYALEDLVEMGGF